MKKTDINKLNTISNIFRFSYGFMILAVGIDNYLNILVNWTEYLNPIIPGFFNTDAKTFMNYMGIFEMFSGTMVLLSPKIGGYIMCILLVFTSINLISQFKYFDIALRDFILAIGAFLFARLSDLIETETKETIALKTDIEELEMVE